MWEATGHEPYASWVSIQLGHLARAGVTPCDAAADRYGVGLEAAIGHGLVPFVMEALVGIADIGIPYDEDERASILELAARHPATTFEVRERARAQLATLTDDVGTDGPIEDADRQGVARAVTRLLADAPPRPHFA